MIFDFIKKCKETISITPINSIYEYATDINSRYYYFYKLKEFLTYQSPKEFFSNLKSSPKSLLLSYLLIILFFILLLFCIRKTIDFIISLFFFLILIIGSLILFCLFLSPAELENVFYFYGSSKYN